MSLWGLREELAPEPARELVVVARAWANIFCTCVDAGVAACEVAAEIHEGEMRLSPDAAAEDAAARGDALSVAGIAGERALDEDGVPRHLDALAERLGVDLRVGARGPRRERDRESERTCDVHGP